MPDKTASARDAVGVAAETPTPLVWTIIDGQSRIVRYAVLRRLAQSVLVGGRQDERIVRHGLPMICTDFARTKLRRLSFSKRVWATVHFRVVNISKKKYLYPNKSQYKHDYFLIALLRNELRSSSTNTTRFKL